MRLKSSGGAVVSIKFILVSVFCEGIKRGGYKIKKLNPRLSPEIQLAYTAANIQPFFKLPNKIESFFINLCGYLLFFQKSAIQTLL